MSGLQEVAAIIGIAELSLRSISALYDLVGELKTVPQEIARIQNESSTLTQSLLALEHIIADNGEAKAIVQRIGLPTAIRNCGEACERLRDDIVRWTSSGGHSVRSKLQFRLHKKTIHNTLAQISFAKQTTILCVTITQLWVHLQVPMSESRRAAEIAVAKKKLERSKRNVPQSSYSKERSKEGKLDDFEPTLRDAQRELAIIERKAEKEATSESDVEYDSPCYEQPSRTGTNPQKGNDVVQEYTNVKADGPGRNEVGNYSGKGNNIRQIFNGLNLAGNGTNVFGCNTTTRAGP